MNMSGALKQAEVVLAPVSDSARRDVEVLLCHVLNQSLTYLRTWPERELSGVQQAAFDELIRKRQQGEPVAYLTGEREFWSMPFLVTSDTLIPRPETELLVEQTLARLPADAPQTVVDLGTGSGVIALALAKERPNWQLTATDASFAALRIAEKNARRLKLENVRFDYGSWYAPLADRRFHAIVSNPPYVADRDPHLAQGDVRFEPNSALVSGDDGLDDIRQIVAGAQAHLLPNGWLMLEHGYDQGEPVAALLREHGFVAVETLRDLAGQPRVTLGQLPG
ncbi:MAG TPA: peptide chain release factor N(5)-glutamine methyltransferase [Permianibacter sp.]|nr:peptide chain release factor N(5)-glutamine methyltransferase [Permianibacter sp.]